MTRRAAPWVGLMTVIVIIDQITKNWAGDHFRETPFEAIPNLVDFTYRENTGAAWSMFRDGGSLIAILAILVVTTIVVLLTRERPRAEAVALSLIGAGAGGNLVDRVTRGPGWFDGAVVDWIRLTFIDFPVFNVADMSITFAVVVMLISALRSR